ncbi:NADPH dehydrogenase, putative [Candida dubliniensis CD36]|uniref:Probable NADPH dehydrogenase n=1 Tax=Candida dubliniensis (strain CD36 / ATCC MYA-646 / CBS 7987 / NCPF 3949 / NRRL Y-17841) TaxID=573826 RepID=B9WIM3_CANDC|nr:NADPH dehydrogenase, putative [Candida dubliniensis CD36]CAX41089.1 NADPH dehydrogenase, putative [Candida dubliniensis CD36]
MTIESTNNFVVPAGTKQIDINPLGSTKLFQPIKIGKNILPHRIVHAPTTRFRAAKNHTPSDLQLQHYKTHSQYPGTLIITEATFTSEQGGMDLHVPGIYNDVQTKSWKKINDEIHANKCFSSIQLWYLGRVANPKDLKDAGLPLIGPSTVYWNEESEKLAKEVGNELRALTEEEIDHIVEIEYPNAAKRAIEAGFDYIEIHSAPGYFLDQFLNPASNKRTDKYGGSIENRARLLLRVVDKLIDIVGADKLAVRLAPWSSFLGMEIEGEEIHSYILQQLQQRTDNKGQQLAYISLIEPRVIGIFNASLKDQKGRSNEFAYKFWKGNILRAGNYTYDAPNFKTLINDLDNDRTIIGFSRFFTSNPDLVEKLKLGKSLNYYNREEFYKYYNYGYNSYDESEKQVIGKPLA